MNTQTIITSSIKNGVRMFEEKRKQYIAPGEVRKINGVEVRAKKVFVEMDEVRCPCTLCIVEKQGICFDPETKHSLSTRPACFGNDPENLSNKSLYYTKP